MFDSENNSLVTRIEAGAGIIVSYGTNSDGENVYTARIDSDYIASLVTVNAGGTLTLSAADEARLAAVEAAVGTTPAPAPAPTPTVPTGTTGTTTITPTQTVALSTSTTEFTYRLVSFDGTTLVDQTIVSGANVSAAQWALTVWAQMKQNNAMLLHMETPTYSSGVVTITWKDAAKGSTVEFDITSSNAADGLAFIIADY